MNRRGKTKEGFLQVKQPSRFGKVSIMRKVFLIVGFHGVATFLPAYNTYNRGRPWVCRRAKASRTG